MKLRIAVFGEHVGEVVRRLVVMGFPSDREKFDWTRERREAGPAAQFWTYLGLMIHSGERCHRSILIKVRIDQSFGRSEEDRWAEMGYRFFFFGGESQFC